VPKHLIFLMNGWDSSAGGIQTVNRELVAAIAKVRPTLSCTVVVPVATRDEGDDAFSRGVNLIAGSRADDWSSVLLSPALRAIAPGDVIGVVGHSYFSGVHAIELRDSLFPSSLSVQFVHTSPLHVESVKEYKHDSYVMDREAKLTKELLIAEKADLVVCIGPRLHRAMHDLLTARGKPAVVVTSINCGMARLPDSLRTLPIRPTLLCLGRTESIGVKGLDIFAYAAGYLSESWSRHPSTRERPAPQFVIRGVQRDEEAFERRMTDFALEVGARPAILVRPYTATRQDLAADYRGATVFLMPSREEGFGLVACEALSYGVPALVSENSGIAEVIRDIAIANHMDVSRCVIPMTGESKAIGRRFADAALEVLVHERRANGYCNMLSERLISICSWEVGAQQLLAAIEDTNARRPSTTLNAAAEKAALQDPAAVLNANLALIDGLPGLLSIHIQQAIVATFEKGYLPNNLPTEISGVALVVREGDPIQQASSPTGRDGDLFIEGRRFGTVGFFASRLGDRILALTAAHVLTLNPERSNVQIQIGSELVSARIEQINEAGDWALLSVPHADGVSPFTQIGEPVVGQHVRIQLPDRLIAGTIFSVDSTMRVLMPNGERIHKGLFALTVSQEVSPGLSGALVISNDYQAVGMVLALTPSQGNDQQTIFAVPMHAIVEGLGIRLDGRSARAAIIPTDEMTLQAILKTIDAVDVLMRNNRRYFTGRLDHRPVIISQVPKVGNIGSAAITTALILDHDIDRIFVVGLCGGLSPGRQSLADVVISSDVVYYEPGLIDSEGRRPRLRVSGATPPGILRLAREMSESAPLSKPHIGIHIGSIASGEKIIRSPEGLGEVLSNWSDFVAVDMEGAGVFEAVASAVQDVSVTIVRGIADFADASKRTEREAASRNAVTVTMELIRRLAAVS
jgi:nucleoside phosphorylase/glycosyltransferase involved in cell wall biosynthesis